MDWKVLRSKQKKGKENIWNIFKNWIRKSKQDSLKRTSWMGYGKGNRISEGAEKGRSGMETKIHAF